MAPMTVAMVPGMSVEAAADDELKADIKEKAADLRAYKISLKPNANQTARIDALLKEAYKAIGYTNDETISVSDCKTITNPSRNWQPTSQ